MKIIMKKKNYSLFYFSAANGGVKLNLIQDLKTNRKQTLRENPVTHAPDTRSGDFSLIL